MSWVEKSAEIRIDSSSKRYRLWDINHAIPRPSKGVVCAQIKLSSGWEDMYFNRVWGKALE